MATNPAPETDDVFEMEEPRPIGLDTTYGFWLSTEEEWVVQCTEEMNCVTAILEVEDGRFLVEIGDDHDPDEAWHWIRTLLEEERRPDNPDIWEEAMRWIL